MIPTLTEHTWTKQRQIRERVTPVGTVYRYPRTRYVCSCGFATSWQKDEKRVAAARDRHAIQGQLSL